MLAGGVALNCVANGKILKSGIFDDIWIQPAAGDAGGALGAAYAVWHIRDGHERQVSRRLRRHAGLVARTGVLDPEIERTLQAVRRQGTVITRTSASWPGRWRRRLAEGKVIGWFQGRMEFGPRALGSRSILGDARNPEMQKKMNLKIKYREGFRPFAPTVLEEDVQEHFELDRPSPYMLLVVPGQGREACTAAGRLRRTQPVRAAVLPALGPARRLRTSTIRPASRPSAATSIRATGS